MHCLVIGYGSIGKRHAHILNSLGCKVFLVTSQKVDHHHCYSSIEEALEKNSIDYIVIANATHLHYSTLMRLIKCDYKGIVLIEKPFFSKVECLPENKLVKILIGYNLRFHELLITAKSFIENEKLVTFSAYVGQYLPTWRKSIDYRHCYSAKKDCGGGVLRDLSHELDYSIWLCGSCDSLAAVGGHFSELEITSDDTYSIIMKCNLCPIVNIHLNYLDRRARREISINTQRNTIFIDLVNGLLSIDGEVRAQCTDAVAKTYLQQHQAVLDGRLDTFCSYEEGLYVMKLIQTIESASASKAWMNL